VQEIAGIFQRLTLVSVIDIALVAAIFYGLLRFFQGTQAVSLLRGILFLAFVVALATSLLPLTAFSWLLRNSVSVFLVAIPVIFQPELRRALERLGRTTPLLGRAAPGTAVQRAIYEVVQAVEMLSRERTGALIVLEGETGLEEHIESGQRVDGEVSARLLTTIFFPNTALHDGAVIIRGSHLIAASCVLPLTTRVLPDSSLGTRHRAGVGITEQNDALAIIVSEETGIVSIARNGRIVRRLDEQRLRRILEAFYHPGRLTHGTDGL
jgi:diadenylate cyclase